ncbi:cupin domain-containing protein [Pelagicoccus albus]|uniref:Cupin domain-containing protein n=1 Tax=Pelagicoccus albus TaxID=415222 RepID=A0A7X1E9U6_9BACT|nr:cupin domain-containing protein [Pelagicoccus albus]MBC2607563.1 cupin domain-containing protein [Pelagicoccus albus]
MDNRVVSLKDKASKLEETWSPRVIGEVNDFYAKVAKLRGNFAWHKHDEEDELFLVISGSLKIELEDGAVELKEGEMYVVPRGEMHNPIAEEECSVLLFERKSTKHTGDLKIARTKSEEDQLRPF